jgi:ATP-dependent DNA helicase RecG
LEDIPNQIKNACGIIPTVTLKKAKGKDVIVIKIKPSPQGISHRSKFYKRSGSTTQELNGAELQAFLLEKNSTDWESIFSPVGGNQF